MEFEDFKANYDRVELCNLSPDSLTEDTKKKWNVNTLEGSWVRGSTAGGCRNYIGKCKVFLIFSEGNGRSWQIRPAWKQGKPKENPNTTDDTVGVITSILNIQQCYL